MRFKLAGVGEVLWDLLPGGRQLGGAPANFAYHACALGAEGHVISRVGRDELGREIISRLQKLGVPVDCIEIDETLPTGTVSVELGPDGQPQFTIHENVAWDALQGEAASLRAAGEADAVCFGTLGQRCEPARSAIRKLVAAAPKNALRIFDVNLRQHFFSTQIIAESLALANVLKVSDVELPKLAEMLNLSGNQRDQIACLAQRHGLLLVALTRGAHGSVLYSEGRFSEHSGIQVNVVDTVGAGDAFTAAMALGMLSGWAIDRINEFANRVAAYVCSCAGATPPLPPELRSQIGLGRA